MTKAKRVTKAEVIAAIDRESARLLRIARDLGEERASRPREPAASGQGVDRATD